MGEFATRVQGRLCEHLQVHRPGYDWTVEAHVAGTPVDVVGRTEATVALVELEWRRADPADNTAKLFRHLAGDELPARRAVVCQLFTGYYDLASGGVSSKRENAEFVGAVAGDSIDRLTYRALSLDVEPPKRGGDPPPDWEAAVEAAADSVADALPD